MENILIGLIVFGLVLMVVGAVVTRLQKKK
jgi:VIT1/CCC1 family predicted Fe2+/Mn2+ transporter